jgi:hypothetical protein
MENSYYIKEIVGSILSVSFIIFTAWLAIPSEEYIKHKSVLETKSKIDTIYIKTK